MLNNFTLKIALIVIAFLLLGWVFSDILTYFVVSLILASILRPLTDFINRIQVFNVRVPRVLSVLLSFAVLVLVVALFILLFIPLISDQIRVISNIDFDDLLYSLEGPIGKIEEFLVNNHFANKEPGFILQSLEETTTKVFNSVDVNTVVNGLIRFTGSIFVSLLAFFFITFFLLYEKGILKRLFLKAIPNEYFELTIAALYKIETLLTNYLTGLLLQMFTIFTLVSVGLSIVGVKYALTIAVFAAVANLIPYVGPFIGGAFGIFVGLTTAPFDLTAEEYLWVVAKIMSVFALVQLTDNLMLQPLIFSKSVKAHPLEIFVVIFAGAALAGAVGMIAAIPVYTILRVSLAELYNGYQQYYIFHRNNKQKYF
jgi:predicted PurR-regulated permease PerM